jgi:RNA polymerase sigma-70 factor (ECF subfamily)
MSSSLEMGTGPGDLGALFASVRPRLHRYCARMVGSSVDGEDIVQETLARAAASFPELGPIANPEGWLFRVAHNLAIDFTRRRARQPVVPLGDLTPEAAVQPAEANAAASLQTLMRLPVAQRSCVILMDVLGYSLEEIAGIVGTTVGAVKASLHRGRTRLRALAQRRGLPSMPLPEPERSLLAAYVERFNARDFDALREMLATEVRLELVNRTRMSGAREVSRYFGNYAQDQRWRLAAGWVDGRPAALVLDGANRAPAYFVILGWSDGKIAVIRDFRYAAYALASADVAFADAPA